MSKTIEEKIAVMQHYANGGEVECLIGDNGEILEPTWNWSSVDYRIKEQKKTVTIEKWLLEQNGEITVVEGNKDRLLSWSNWVKLKLLDTYEVNL